jgi:hypothetical protein
LEKGRRYREYDRDGGIPGNFGGDFFFGEGTWQSSSSWLQQQGE